MEKVNLTWAYTALEHAREALERFNVFDEATPSEWVNIISYSLRLLAKEAEEEEDDGN